MPIVARQGSAQAFPMVTGPRFSRHHWEMTDSAQQFGFSAVGATLGASTDVDACVALATRLDGLIEEAIAAFQADGAGIACRAGCNFCCHLRVMIFPHEAIALFRYLGSRMPEDQAALVRKRVLENAAHIKQLAREGRAATNLPCAFLVDGKCSAYEARPAACSGYHSLSREKCEESFNSGGNLPAGIPLLSGLRYVAGALDDGVEQGLGAAGLDATRVELNTAVAALIRNPALIQRWRSGRELKI
jgi:Fe-S-cluster containining protein